MGRKVAYCLRTCDRDVTDEKGKQCILGEPHRV